MEKNSRKSCTGNSIHIIVRYFFVKVSIYKGEVRVKYCPTYSILAEYFTNPIMGKCSRSSGMN